MACSIDARAAPTRANEPTISPAPPQRRLWGLCRAALQNQLLLPLLTYHLAMQNFRLGEGAALPIMMLPIIGLLVLGVASYMDKEATQ